MNSDELRAAFLALSPLAGEQPAYTWHKHRAMLRQHVANDRPEEMLRWSTVTATMFVGTGAVFSPIELARLTPRYLGVIAEPWVGSPEPYNGWTSGNLIHQAYHLMQWEEATGQRVETLDTIVEIGGGYGALALLCARLGFAGRYIIADLPESQLLQRYYLANCGVSGVWWCDLQGLPWQADLLVALYSITEMELADRWAVLDRVSAAHVLMCHQPTFTPFHDRIDNVAWSAEVVGRFPGPWVRRTVDLPGLEGHLYVLR